MTVAFWIINIVLALAFLASGGMKLARGKDDLRAAKMGWVDDFSGNSIKLIGLVEVLGAIGLVLPKLVGVAPILAPVAAVGLAVVMVGAVVVHVRRHEQPTPPAVLGVLSIVSAVVGVAVV